MEVPSRVVGMTVEVYKMSRILGTMQREGKYHYLASVFVS